MLADGCTSTILALAPPTTVLAQRGASAFLTPALALAVWAEGFLFYGHFVSHAFSALVLDAVVRARLLRVAMHALIGARERIRARAVLWARR